MTAVPFSETPNQGLHERRKVRKDTHMTSTPSALAKFVTPTTAAAILGVHRDTVRRWADKGLIPCFRTPSHRRLLLRSDVENFMQGIIA